MKNKFLLIMCVFAFESMQIPVKPRVLIIGDSVSIGYTPFVIDKLADIADVTRPNANCGSTRIGLRDMEKWLGDTAWTVIHFNFGLHDLGYRYANDTNLNKDSVYATPKNGGHLNVSLEEYEANLHKIIARLKKTGAQLIFATTTPVSADLHSYVKDSELPYNEVAIRVMKEEKILINDLWKKIKPQIDTTQIPGNPHFTRPYTSQDKGTVENRIGVIRRFFPKKTDLTFITHQQVREVEQKLNNRPVRKFNYQTPNQVLQGKIALIT